jgi:hypothetical protein
MMEEFEAQMAELSAEQLMQCLLHVCKRPREQAAANSWLTKHAEQPYTRAMQATALMAFDAAVALERKITRLRRGNSWYRRDNTDQAAYVATLEPLLPPVQRELERGRPVLCLELATDLVNHLNAGIDDERDTNYGEPGEFAERVDALCVQCIAALAAQQPALEAAQVEHVSATVRAAFEDSAWKHHRGYGWPDDNVFKSIAALKQLAPQDHSADADDKPSKRQRCEDDAADTSAGALLNPVNV